MTLLCIGLLYNITSQYIDTKKGMKNQSIQSKEINNSTIIQSHGEVNYNQINIIVTNPEDVERILNSLKIPQKNTNIEFLSYTGLHNNFISLFSGLPWVKKISPFKNRQDLAISNNSHNIPDFIVCYETSSLEIEEIIIKTEESNNDVHITSVNKDEIEKYLKTSLLIVIYWGKYKIWTLNSLENFQHLNGKSEIDFESAIKNDFSTILGDITFIFSKFMLQITYDKSIKDDNSVKHGEYGSVISTELLLDDYSPSIELSPIEVAVIDSSIDMAVERVEKNGNITKVMEINESTYMLRLSSLILRHIAVFGVEPDGENIVLSRITIVELMKKLKAIQSYQLPFNKTAQSDRFYKQAFHNTRIFEDYKK